MVSMIELDQAWKEIIPRSGCSIGRRADKNHLLDFFITYDENNNMQMMLLSDVYPKMPQSSDQILVRVNRRQYKKYAVFFSLIVSRLRDQFVSLCWDLMNCTADALNNISGVKRALKRFCMWQKLFAEGKNKGLSDAEVKGLIGELCAFKNVVLAQYPPRTAAAGWIGPIGADRDFEFSDTWYEAKSIALSKDTVTISSADQLDIHSAGILLILRIEKISPDTPGCFTLNSLVNEIRSILEDIEARKIFESKLLASKYDASDPSAAEPYFLYRIEKYCVHNDFPRICRSTIPAEVSNCTYTLSVSGLQKWRQD